MATTRLPVRMKALLRFFPRPKESTDVGQDRIPNSTFKSSYFKNCQFQYLVPPCHIIFSGVVTKDRMEENGSAGVTSRKEGRGPVGVPNAGVGIVVTSIDAQGRPPREVTWQFGDERGKTSV